MIISFTLNDEEVEIDTAPHRRAADLLREEFDIRSLKSNCTAMFCNLCIILVNENPVQGCNLPAFQLRFKHVTTLEGIIDSPEYQDIAEGYRLANVHPCQSCIPARTLVTYERLSKKYKPTAQETWQTIDSVQCSCCSTRRLQDALLRTVQIREKRLYG